MPRPECNCTPDEQGHLLTCVQLWWDAGWVATEYDDDTEATTLRRKDY